MRRLSFLSLLAIPLVLGCKDKATTDDSSNTADDSQVTANDKDGDGFGDDDCDDNDAEVYPGADEICDGVDNNCDGDEDEGVTTTFYADSDGDGFGDDNDTKDACEKPDGYVPEGGDCADTLNQVYPGAAEQCNEKDDNCNDEVDEGTTGIWYKDADGDGFGDAENMVEGCPPDAGWVQNADDCDDSLGLINPDALEKCNDVDDDCDEEIDESATDGTELATDADGDGFGQPGTMTVQCDGADNELDCDDTKAAEPVVVKTTGSSSGSGTSASPLDTIQAGIDQAKACVVVFPGNYAEAIDFGGKNISVTGIGGAASTTIEGNGEGPSVTFDGGETYKASLVGFTVTGGTGHVDSSTEVGSCSSTSYCTTTYTTYCGGGIYINSSSPTIDDVVVKANELAPATTTAGLGSSVDYVYSYGGGVCAIGSSSAFTGVELRNNYADQGGGIFIDENSSITMDQSIVMSNTATDGAGIQLAGTLTTDNLLSAWNIATDSGGAAYVDGGTLTATNATFAYDDGATGAELYFAGGASTVNNSIATGGNTGALVQAAGGTVTGSYNNVYSASGTEFSGMTDPTGIGGNISADPTFTALTDNGNDADDDFTLKAGSPCIDSGNPAAAYMDADGTTNDMGCYGGPGSVW